MATDQQATIDDLYRADGKAELVEGQIVMMSPTGDMHNRAAGAIYVSLRMFERSTAGRAFADNAGFLVDLPQRKSFSPDAAFYTGEPAGMKFLSSAPDFAVEVRSHEDYGPAAEQRLAEKRHDYFTAGTLVVWDVDLKGSEIVRVYRSDSPQTPKIYRRGETAEAEPAVPGWTMPVNELFDGIGEA